MLFPLLLLILLLVAAVKIAALFASLVVLTLDPLWFLEILRLLVRLTVNTLSRPEPPGDDDVEEIEGEVVVVVSLAAGCIDCCSGQAFDWLWIEWKWGWEGGGVGVFWGGVWHGEGLWRCCRCRWEIFRLAEIVKSWWTIPDVKENKHYNVSRPYLNTENETYLHRY